MPDRDDLGHAWRVTPTEYLARRPATHDIPQPTSQYLTMRDGVKLAVDVYLPKETEDWAPASAGATAGDESLPRRREPNSTVRFPTILILTPYYRRFKLTQPGMDPSPNAGRYRDMFVPRGYAMVVVDVRGTGASFGTRDSFRSPREVEDHREVADWIVAQPWSDGTIGSTGISYLGAAGCFLAGTGHPAVKAIAPLFAVHDTYADHVFPGGVMCTTVTAHYDDLVTALDQDLREALKPYPYFNHPTFAGPQPVDDDPDGTLLAAAIEEHRGSFRLRDMAVEMAFREEAVPSDPHLHSGACSPYAYLPNAKGKTAIYSISGWYDGSAFANAAVSRFLTMAGPHDRLLLGPWDHGARTNGSPFRDAPPESQFPLLAEVLRFFDTHLMDLDTKLEDEAPIHFHTVQEERWQAATQWPPHPQLSRWHLHADGALVPSLPSAPAKVRHHAKFSATTGTHSRYERLAALAILDYYPDWTKHERAMLQFTSAPFDRDTELTGHAIVNLDLATSEHDASVFAYLAEVDAQGRSRYITEGMLRLLHRREQPPPSNYAATWPWRSFHRADARRMEPGVAESFRFALLPISWKVMKGSRLRLSIAGTDADHFAQVPHGRPPTFEITVGGPQGSFLELPLR